MVVKKKETKQAAKCDHDWKIVADYTNDQRDPRGKIKQCRRCGEKREV